MGRRYIYHDGDIYLVVGIGQARDYGLCFTAIELKYVDLLPNDNIPSIRVPIGDAIEITEVNALEMLRILYEE